MRCNFNENSSDGQRGKVSLVFCKIVHGLIMWSTHFPFCQHVFSLLTLCCSLSFTLSTTHKLSIKISFYIKMRKATTFNGCLLVLNLCSKRERRCAVFGQRWAFSPFFFSRIFKIGQGKQKGVGVLNPLHWLAVISFIRSWHPSSDCKAKANRTRKSSI